MPQDRVNTQRLLVGGFVAVIALTVLLAAGTVWKLSTMADLAARLFRHPFTVSNALLDINSQILLIDRYVDDLSQANRPEDVAATAARIDRARAQVFEHLDLVAERFLGDKARVAEVRATFTSWAETLDGAVDLRRQGDFEAANTKLRAGQAMQLAMLTGQLDGLLRFARDRANAFAAESAREYAKSRILLYGLMALVLGGSTAIAVGVVLRIRASQRRIAENEMQISRMARIIEDSGIEVHTVDPTTRRIIESSPNACANLGMTADDLRGRRFDDLIPEGERDAFGRRIHPLVEGTASRSTVECRLRRKDGSVYDAGVTLNLDRSGTPAILHVIVTDTTELKMTERQLRQLRKMEAVGQMSGGIAHDFNNILGVIMGNLDILGDFLADNAKAQERLAAAREGAERGAKLTRNLLGLARAEPMATALTSVNQFIEGMADVLAKSLTASIRVETYLADNLWLVEIDPGDLQDAILNLAVNARDAMPQGGLLVIETSNKILDEQYVLRNPGSREGEHVMVSVSDTGTGMVPELLEKIFEPFFTTKARGRGTGLGLSMVYSFVKRADGHIKVYSEPGRGTTFRIYLPRAVGTAVPEKIPVIAAEEPRGSETILVVDDEEDLVSVAVKQLEVLGYRAFSATSPKQALEILRNRDDIDLLFSDVVMPGGMDGYHLAGAAVEMRPRLKVLLTSGYTRKREEFVNGDAVLHARFARNLLSKPYGRAEIAAQLRRVLDAAD